MTVDDILEAKINYTHIFTSLSPDTVRNTEPKADNPGDFKDTTYIEIAQNSKELEGAILAEPDKNILKNVDVEIPQSFVGTKSTEPLHKSTLMEGGQDCISKQIQRG